jgi:hypothetical protein
VPLKYQTLAELAEAYKSGELSQNDPLWLDNDTASVYVTEVAPDGDDEDSVQVFQMHPGLILNAALDLLYIPHEGV